MSEKSLISRKFRVGVWVRTKSGLVGKVIGSAIYGAFKRPDGSYETRHAWVEYRIKVPGKAKTMYRKENDLRKAESPRG